MFSCLCAPKLQLQEELLAHEESVSLSSSETPIESETEPDGSSEDALTLSDCGIVNDIPVDERLSWLSRSNIGKNVIETNYKLERNCGEGGSASVFSAIDKQSGARVAIKRMAKSEVGPQMFNTEATLLYNLRHKGVIKFINAAMDKSYYYLVLEYAGGGDLMQALKLTGGRFDEKTAATVIRRLLRTIKWLHDQNIAHRDLKLDNIVMKKPGGYPILVDFAMAVTVPQDQTTIVTDLCGTPYYAAPEKWRAHYAAALKPSDMWAVGVIAYGLVYGYLPFYGKSMRQTEEKIKRCRYAVVRDGIPTSDEFKDFVSRLLVKDYRKRLTAKEALKHPWVVGKRV